MLDKLHYDNYWERAGRAISRRSWYGQGAAGFALSERRARSLCRGCGKYAARRLHQPAHRPARQLRPDRWLCPRSGQQAALNGIKIGDKTYKVNSSIRTPNPIRRAPGNSPRTLISGDGVDMMLAISTPETINPVADACEAAGVPCLSTVMPWEAWYFGRGAKPGAPSPFKWTYHFGFGGE